jgi:hypothetical protein
MALLTLGLAGEPVLLVSGGETDRAGALELRKKTERILRETGVAVPVRLRRVAGVWLAEAGPLERSRLEKGALAARLAAAGLDPMLLPAVRGSSAEPPSPRFAYRIEWGVLALLALLGAGYFLHRFRETRRLSGSQKELEESQLRLEREMKEGEKNHAVS